MLRRSASMSDSSPPRQVVPGIARCPAHGIVLVPAQGCRSGCAKAFLQPVYSDDADVPSPGSLAMQRIPALDRARNAAAQGHPDERLTEAEVRAHLREVLSRLPQGSKKPFARLCGYRAKWALHTLRGVAKGRAMLPDASRIRLSRLLNELFRGEWLLIETGMLTTAGRPSHAWRRRESLIVMDEQ